ncbi:flavin reductase family protein [Rhizobium sp. YIM 134829]|uniref:flavin reductase family protein n=1 Tax=Rhizobium sp. YIM 134829 TaxID=3390453 RepID=UPI00397D3B9F
MNIQTAPLIPLHAEDPEARPDADPQALKAALRRLAGGVSVITTGTGDARTGATVTSATALSMHPPRMLVSLNRSSSTWPVLEAHGFFGVNIIGPEHQTIANQFAGVGGLKGVDRYQGGAWQSLLTGALLLEDAVAAIDCEVEEAIERHSHVLVIGRVVGVRTGEGVSLAYVDGAYHRLG